MPKNLKKYFPIFKNNKNLIFLDSSASAQKPKKVIDDLKYFLENDYSNIHRGMYFLAQKSENVYEKSKEKLAEFLNCDKNEIIYTYNSNFALNFLSQSFRLSKILKSGDEVLVSEVEHHANIVPWQILEKEIGIKLKFIKLKKDFSLDLKDLKNNLNEKTKIVSITNVSNVTGKVFDIKNIGKIVKSFDDKIIFISDLSQSFPHFKVDIKDLGIDFGFFTAHKFMADSGIGILFGKKEFLENLDPIFSGGGAISKVGKTSFSYDKIPEKFEAGTPNISGARTILSSLEFIEEIGGFEKIEEIEKDLVKYFLQESKKRKFIKIIGSEIEENRIGVFSFEIEGIHGHDLAEFLSEKNICVRSGFFCTEPFFAERGIKTSCRASIYLYNTRKDLKEFFYALDEAFRLFKSL